jgi:hypothetical protein
MTTKAERCQGREAVSQHHDCKLRMTLEIPFSRLRVIVDGQVGRSENSPGEFYRPLKVDWERRVTDEMFERQMDVAHFGYNVLTDAGIGHRLPVYVFLSASSQAKTGRPFFGLSNLVQSLLTLL